MDELLTEQEVADRVDRTRQTLWRWRRDGKGPPFIKIGRTVRYPAQGFEQWLNSKRIEPEADGNDDNRPAI